MSLPFPGSSTHEEPRIKAEEGNHNGRIKTEETDESTITAPDISLAHGQHVVATGSSVPLQGHQHLAITPMSPARIHGYEVIEELSQPDPNAHLKCSYPGCGRSFKRKSDKTLHFKHEKWSLSDLPYKCHQRGCTERFLLQHDAEGHIAGCKLVNTSSVVEGVSCRYGAAAFIPLKEWVAIATGHAHSEILPNKKSPTADPQEPDLWLVWRQVPLRKAPLSGCMADRIRFMKDQWRDSFTPVPYETLDQYVSRQYDRVGLNARSKEALIQQYAEFAGHTANVNLLPPDEADRRHPGRDRPFG